MGGPKKPKPDYKLMKQTYEGWLTDIEDWYEKSQSENRARLAASGITEESDLWKKSMKALESDYQSRLDEVYGSQTYKMVQDYTTAVVGRGKQLGLEIDPDTWKVVGGRLKRGVDEEELMGFSPGIVPSQEGMRFNFGARPAKPGLKSFKKVKGKIRRPPPRMPDRPFSI